MRKPEYKIAEARWRQDNRDMLLARNIQRGIDHRAFLDAWKEGCACLDCGESYAPYCMEFDHVRGIKTRALGNMTNASRRAVLEEIAKCDLVCCACHRVRTHSRRETHGHHTGSKARWSSNRLLTFRAWIDTLKSKPCLDCGRVRPSVAMDFDHVRGEKTAQISCMWRYARERVLAEIEKCDLVCCICHRVRTQVRRAA